MIDIPSLIGQRVQGPVRAAQSHGTQQLKGVGKFFGRMVNWFSQKLPGAGKRAERHNNAIIDFIQKSNPSLSPHGVRSAVDAYATAGKTMTARQVRQITVRLQHVGQSPVGKYLDHHSFQTQQRHVMGQVSRLSNAIDQFNPGQFVDTPAKTLLAEKPSLFQQVGDLKQQKADLLMRGNRLQVDMEQEGITVNSLHHPFISELDTLKGNKAKQLDKLHTKLRIAMSDASGPSAPSSQGIKEGTKAGKKGKKSVRMDLNAHVRMFDKKDGTTIGPDSLEATSFEDRDRDANPALKRTS